VYEVKEKDPRVVDSQYAAPLATASANEAIRADWSNHVERGHTVNRQRTYDVCSCGTTWWPSADAAYLFEGAVSWALAILENELETPDDMWPDHIRQAADLLRAALPASHEPK
jgi:hypothetical protein